MTEYFWVRVALVVSFIAFIISVTTCVNVAEATVATPEGYEWSSDKGALRISTDNKHIYIFDTYETLTIAKDKIVSWGVTSEANLTDLGKDLKGRLMKINDIGSVFVGYRVIMLRKFPLSDWMGMTDQIYKALE